jgi:hypothetical protein
MKIIINILQKKVYKIDSLLLYNKINKNIYN